MKTLKRTISIVAVSAIIGGIGVANAASKADYDKVRAATMSEIHKLQKEDIAPWSPSPKKPILHKADGFAKKGDYAKAIKQAEYVKSLQKIAVKEWKSQPNPGPYKPW